MGKRWNIYSLLLIVLLFLVFSIRYQLFPNFLDIYYHLSVATGFEKAGGYVPHAFWEFAPEGRVNLYPPLFHFILLGLIKTGLPLICVARLVSVLVFPLFLLTIWSVVRSLYNERTAFFATVIGALTYSFYLCSATFIPTTIAFILGLLAFWTLAKGKEYVASLLLALCFYTHPQVPWVFVITLSIYAFWSREQVGKTFKAMLIAALLAAPLLIFQGMNLSSYDPHSAYESFIIEIALVLILSLAGIGKALQERKVYLFPVAFVLAELFFVWSYPYRYLSGQGLLGAIMLSAIGIDHFLKERTFPRWFWIVLFSVLFFAPSLVIMPHKQIQFLPVNATWINLVDPQSNMARSNDRPLYSDFIQEIVTIVKNNTRKEDIIFTNLPLAGTMVSSLAQRANAQGMLQEVRSRPQGDPISNSKLIIWFKIKEERDPGQVALQYGLTKVAETEMAYIYKNESCQAKALPEKALIPNSWILVIFLVPWLFLIALNFLCQDRSFL